MMRRYNATFPVGSAGLRLGTGTIVTIRGLHVASTGTSGPCADGQATTPVRITATLEVEAYSTLVAGVCARCDAPAPPPDDDGLWYILENHDGNRLLFPRGEDAYWKPERDSYPAPGWETLMGHPYCAECLRRKKAK